MKSIREMDGRRLRRLGTLFHDMEQDTVSTGPRDLPEDMQALCFQLIGVAGTLGAMVTAEKERRLG